MPEWGKIAVYTGVAVGAYFIARTVFAGREEESVGTLVPAGVPPVGPWDDTFPPQPIYVGQRGDPELESLFQEMDDYFRSYGIALGTISAAEVTEMRKTNGYYAIPPREYWPRMAATIRYVFMPIRAAVAGPVTITSAYRPPDYNEAVGGTAGSRHQFFEALDMVAPQGLANTQALAAAKIFNRYGELLRMGFGVYGSPGQASNIHVDTGSRERTWENADYWAEQAIA